MSNIVHFSAPRRDPPSPFEDFMSARSTMLAALLAWLETNPGRGEANDEVAGTLSAVRQLASLYGGSCGR